MKRIVFLILAAAAVAVSCSREKGLKTEIYEKEVVVALAEDAADSITMKVKLEYPVSGISDEAVQAMTKSILGQSVEYTGETPDMEAAIDKYVEATVANYRDTNLPYWEESKEEGVSFMGLSWEDEIIGTFDGSHGDVISYVLYSYSYQGGAHGSWGNFVTNFSLKDGSVVTEDDLFVPDYRAELSKILTDHLYDSMGDPEAYDCLFVKEIEPNGNFEVSEEGLSYLYNPYEIGPYAIGLVTVTVPWQELEHILK